MTTPDPLTAHLNGAWEAAASGTDLAGDGPDSILSPLESERGRNEWEPIAITDLGPSSPPSWLWEGFLAAGLVTLFTGLWKAGKSTLIGWLLADLERGGGLVPSPLGTRTLVITEEDPSLWCRRRDELGLGERVHILPRPFKVRPSLAQWETFVAHVAGLVARRGYGLVILDTISALWPVEDENSASHVTAALRPLHALAEHRAAVLLVHHPRKGDAGEAQAARGSGAIPSFVDVILELRRFAAEDPRDRRRVLRAYSRLSETPPETVLELTDQGYAVIGDSAVVTKADRLAMIAAILRDAPEPLTPEQVRGRWPGGIIPGPTTIADDLRTGAEQGRWGRTGTGRRGSPFRYAAKAGFDSPTPSLLEERNETGDPGTKGDGA